MASKEPMTATATTDGILTAWKIPKKKFLEACTKWSITFQGLCQSAREVILEGEDKDANSLEGVG